MGNLTEPEVAPGIQKVLPEVGGGPASRSYSGHRFLGISGRAGPTSVIHCWTEASFFQVCNQIQEKAKLLGHITVGHDWPLSQHWLPEG